MPHTGLNSINLRDLNILAGISLVVIVASVTIGSIVAPSPWTHITVRGSKCIATPEAPQQQWFIPEGPSLCHTMPRDTHKLHPHTHTPLHDTHTATQLPDTHIHTHSPDTYASTIPSDTHTLHSDTYTAVHMPTIHPDTLTDTVISPDTYTDLQTSTTLNSSNTNLHTPTLLEYTPSTQPHTSPHPSTHHQNTSKHIITTHAQPNKTHPSRHPNTSRHTNRHPDTTTHTDTLSGTSPNTSARSLMLPNTSTLPDTILAPANTSSLQALITSTPHNDTQVPNTSLHNIVFAFQFPGQPQGASRWQQRLAGLLRLRLIHHHQQGWWGAGGGQLSLITRLGYSDRPSAPPALLAHTVQSRHVSCSPRQEHRFGGATYHCAPVPLVVLYSLYHPHYIVNIRIEGDGQSLKQIQDLYVSFISKDGRYTRILVALKTVFFPALAFLLLWYLRALRHASATAAATSPTVPTTAVHYSATATSPTAIIARPETTTSTTATLNTATGSISIAPTITTTTATATSPTTATLNTTTGSISIAPITTTTSTATVTPPTAARDTAALATPTTARVQATAAPTVCTTAGGTSTLSYFQMMLLLLASTLLLVNCPWTYLTLVVDCPWLVIVQGLCLGLFYATFMTFLHFLTHLYLEPVNRCPKVRTAMARVIGGYAGALLLVECTEHWLLLHNPLPASWESLHLGLATITIILVIVYLAYITVRVYSAMKVLRRMAGQQRSDSRRSRSSVRLWSAPGVQNGNTAKERGSVKEHSLEQEPRKEREVKTARSIEKKERDMKKERQTTNDTDLEKGGDLELEQVKKSVVEEKDLEKCLKEQEIQLSSKESKPTNDTDLKRLVGSEKQKIDQKVKKDLIVEIPIEIDPKLVTNQKQKDVKSMKDPGQRDPYSTKDPKHTELPKDAKQSSPELTKDLTQNHPELMKDSKTKDPNMKDPKQNDAELTKDSKQRDTALSREPSKREFKLSLQLEHINSPQAPSQEECEVGTWSNAAHDRRQGWWREGSVLLVSWLCVLLTAVEFIIQRLHDGMWIWEDIFGNLEIENTSGLLLGVYSAWNVFTCVALLAYPPLPPPPPHSHTPQGDTEVVVERQSFHQPPPQPLQQQPSQEQQQQQCQQQCPGWRHPRPPLVRQDAIDIVSQDSLEGVVVMGSRSESQDSEGAVLRLAVLSADGLVSNDDAVSVYLISTDNVAGAEVTISETTAGRDATAVRTSTSILSNGIMATTDQPSDLPGHPPRQDSSAGSRSIHCSVSNASVSRGNSVGICGGGNGTVTDGRRATSSILVNGVDARSLDDDGSDIGMIDDDDTCDSSTCGGSGGVVGGVAISSSFSGGVSGSFSAGNGASAGTSGSVCIVNGGISSSSGDGTSSGVSGISSGVSGGASGSVSGGMSGSGVSGGGNHEWSGQLWVRQQKHH